MTKEAEIYSGEDSLFQENLESYIKINKIRIVIEVTTHTIEIKAHK